MLFLLEILYQDQWLVAVHKPAGLLVHRSKIAQGETQFAMQLLRDQLGQHVFPVHRLDKPVSGVLLFALDPDTARLMVDGFSSGKIHKTYRAVVRGFIAEHGTIDYALAVILDKTTDGLADPNKAPRQAVTHYRRLATTELPIPVGRYTSARYSLVELRPLTGRRHQLRRHMRHIFHPIVGDTTYGDGKHNVALRQFFHSSRLMLAATDLRFEHPHTRQPIRVAATPDSEFAATIAQLGLSESA